MDWYRRDPTGTLPPGSLGPSKFIRQWIGLSAVGERVECEPYGPGNGDWASSVELEVSLIHSLGHSSRRPGWIPPETERDTGLV